MAEEPDWLKKARAEGRILSETRAQQMCVLGMPVNLVSTTIKTAAASYVDDLPKLLKDVESAGAGKPEAEWRFHETRMWRFDLAWPILKVAFEREGIGGTHAQGIGRHQTKKGMANDCEKYNEAALDGWIVIRATAAMIRDGLAAKQLARALSLRKELCRLLQGK